MTKYPFTRFGQTETRTAPTAARVVSSIILYGPLSYLLIASGLYVAKNARLIYANLTPIVAAEAARQLHREVRIGHVTISRLGQLEIDGLDVANGSTFRQGHDESLLSTRRVLIDYSVHDLLFDSANTLHAITRIELQDPSVVVERRDDRSFNFTDLLSKPNSPARKPFSGVLVCDGGTLLFRDFLAPVSVARRPAVNVLQHISATVDCTSDELVKFVASGESGASRFSAASVSGIASRTRAGTFRMSLDAKDVDAVYWSTYFKSFPQFRVLGGSGDIAAMISHTGKITPSNSQVDFVANVALRNLEALPSDRRYLTSPITGITGHATLDSVGAVFSGFAEIAGQPIAASLNIFDFVRPQLVLSLQGRDLNFDAISRAIPKIKIPASLRISPVSGTAQFVGSVTRPSMTAQVSVPWIAYQGNIIRNIASRVSYTNNVLTVPQLDFDSSGGQHSNLSVVVNPTQIGQSLVASGTLRGINIASVALPSSLRALNLGGIVNASFVTDHNGALPRIVADFNITNFRARRTSIQNVNGRVAWANGQPIEIDRMTVSDPKVVATVTGFVPTKPSADGVNLNVSVAGLKVHQIASPYTKNYLGGLAYFTGKITGSFTAPQAQGRFEVYNAKYGKYSLDAVGGPFQYDPSRLAFQNVVARKFPASARFDGVIGHLASADPVLNVKAHMAKADIQDLISVGQSLATGSTQPSLEPKFRIHVKGRAAAQVVAALPTITGATTADFTATGTLHKPNVVGTTTLTDGTIGPFRMDQLHARVSYTNNTLNVDNGVLRGEGATITANGSMNLTHGNVIGIFTANDFNLERLDRLILPYADVEGIVDVSGALSGTMATPSVSLGLVGHDLQVNHQHLAPLTAFASYVDGQVTLNGDPWDIVILNPPGVENPSVPVEYRIDKLSLLLPTPSHPHRIASIDASGSLPTAAPERIGHVIESLRASYLARTAVGQSLISKLTSLPVPLSGAFSIPSIEVRGPLKKPDISALVHVQGLQSGSNSIASGDLTVTSEDGGVRSNHVDGTFTGIKLATVPLDTLKLAATSSGSVITLSTFHAVSSKAYLDAHGTADIDGTMNASLDASNVPLSIFDGLLPRNRSIEGTIGDLTVEATGSTLQPNLVASLNLDHPAFAIAGAAQLSTPADPQSTKKGKSRGGRNANQATPQDRYSLDSIRTGILTVSPAKSGHGRVLTIGNLVAYKNGVPVADLTGTIPMSRSLLDFKSAVRYDPSDLHAVLNVQDLGFLAAFAPGVDPIRTRGHLVATLNPGTDTSLSGLATLTNGSLGLTGIGTALTGANGALRFNGNELSIVSLSAHGVTGGTVSLGGHVEYGNPDATAAVATLALTFNEFQFDEGSQSFLSRNFGSSASGTVDGELNIAGPIVHPNVFTQPGHNILVSSAVGSIPTSSAATPGTAGTFPIDPNFNVHVTLGGNGKYVRAQNALLTAETQGRVDLGGSLKHPTLNAHLNIYKGHILIPPATLLTFVQPYGSLDLVYPVPIYDEALGYHDGLSKFVELNAEASVNLAPSMIAQTASITQTVGSPSSASAPSSFGNLDMPVHYVIKVHIQGSLDDPNKLTLELQSDPGGLSRTAMLAALGHVELYSGLLSHNGEGAVKDQLANVFSGVVLPTLFQPIESSVEDALGLSSFSVDYTPNTPIHVTLIKPLAKRLEVTYSRSFGNQSASTIGGTIPPMYTVSLGYNLTKRLQVSVGTDDQHNDTISVNGIFGF